MKAPWFGLARGGLAFVWVLRVTLADGAASTNEVLDLGDGLQVIRGAVNGALLSRGDRSLLVYGDPRPEPARVEAVLFTHHRRDVAWAGLDEVAAGARAVVPGGERDLFAEPEAFWSEFREARFHDYRQQSTKVLTRAVGVSETVGDGELFSWRGASFRVLDTPGYTRGAVTYLLELSGRKVAFTGDLILDGGRLFDLYSLQDAIPEAKIGGYHGYAARLGQHLASLDRVAAAAPDLIVPVRGPIIRSPLPAIATLKARIQALYANYLTTDALRWYFKDDHMQAKARRVLGPGVQPSWPPLAETQPLPSWIVPISNSRLILAADGAGFLVDCGSPGIMEELGRLQEEGRLTGIHHVFVTHYHDDHTDRVQAVAERYGATVHASPVNRDVLEHPGAYRLPCLTTHPIQVSGRTRDGERWRWKEFDLTLYWFPGQTLNHDALLVRKENGESIFFIGDSFTPSGLDDYCLLNRNLLHEGTGYFHCLDLLRKTGTGVFLVNQHVPPMFRFSPDRIDWLSAQLEARVEVLRELLPWDDPNFGVDESWARFHPYALDVRPGRTFELNLRIMNHSPHETVFETGLHLPEGWKLLSLQPPRLRLPARMEGEIRAVLEPQTAARPGLHVITADLRSQDWDLREWTEAMVTLLAEQ